MTESSLEILWNTPSCGAGIKIDTYKVTLKGIKSYFFLDYYLSTIKPILVQMFYYLKRPIFANKKYLTDINILL